MNENHAHDHTFTPGDPVAVTYGFDGSGIALRFSATFVDLVPYDATVAVVKIDPAVGPAVLDRLHTVTDAKGNRYANVKVASCFRDGDRLDTSDGLYR